MGARAQEQGFKHGGGGKGGDSSQGFKHGGGGLSVGAGTRAQGQGFINFGCVRGQGFLINNQSSSHIFHGW